MSKKLIIAVVAVLAVVAVALSMKDNQEDAGEVVDETTTGTPKASAQVTPKGATKETTASSGTYLCEGGKTFTLAVLGDGTARARGASSSSVVLRKSSLGIWISSDSRVAVRETAGYTILVENDVTTRDRCYLR